MRYFIFMFLIIEIIPYIVEHKGNMEEIFIQTIIIAFIAFIVSVKKRNRK
ncbi:hypothetical protein ANBU17_12170 [Anaerostipes butyraticus]|uniref:Uncharacterized protein n=1 Tax=Anaerostipes butyraticus TaxID=645466 RepID=A0A916Q8K5_9FIRM|nr:hypothetical protein ANBU17_12170 [Anaerostipes butyraticus]